MMNLYHIVTAHGTIEVPAENEKEALRKALYPLDVEGIYAMPITEETLLDTDEFDYDHDLGTVTYTIKHWVNEDGEYYTVEMTDLYMESEKVDDVSYADIGSKLASLDGEECFNSIDEAKKAIMWALDEAADIYEDAEHIQWPDEDAAYDEWRCNH